MPHPTTLEASSARSWTCAGNGGAHRHFFEFLDARRAGALVRPPCWSHSPWLRCILPCYGRRGSSGAGSCPAGGPGGFRRLRSPGRLWEEHADRVVAPDGRHLRYWWRVLRSGAPCGRERGLARPPARHPSTAAVRAAACACSRGGLWEQVIAKIMGTQVQVLINEEDLQMAADPRVMKVPSAAAAGAQASLTPRTTARHGLCPSPCSAATAKSAAPLAWSWRARSGGGTTSACGLRGRTWTKCAPSRSRTRGQVRAQRARGGGRGGVTRCLCRLCLPMQRVRKQGPDVL